MTIEQIHRQLVKCRDALLELNRNDLDCVETLVSAIEEMEYEFQLED